MAKSFERYGTRWNYDVKDADSNVDISLAIEIWAMMTRRTVEQGGIGFAGHFHRFVELNWGEGNAKQFIWNPWNEEMLDASCKNKYLAVSGCSSSGKTEFYSIWALVNWYADPMNTLVFVTSTNLGESRQRIWGRIKSYHQNSKWQLGGALKLVDSSGMIKLDMQGASDESSIKLIAGEKKREAEAVGKLIGKKNRRVIFIGDELPELSPAILEACYTNLAMNQEFQLIGLGNFNSIYDTFGTFCMPVNGWGSINPTMDEWETICYGQNGKCLRFDGMKSPNVVLGRNEYKGIYNLDNLAAHKKLNENSLGFWRQCRSFPCPEGDRQYIYSEADFIQGKAHESVIWLGGEKTRVAFLDPAFTHDGDDAMMYLGWLGTDRERNRVLLYDRCIKLTEDVTKKEEFSIQVANQFVAICKQEGVRPEHAGLDHTGAITFGEYVAQIWATNILRVSFGGAPSNKPADSTGKTCKDAYGNRVSELWYMGVEFIRSQQIRGLDPETAKQLKSRKYELGDRGKVYVESKKEMKKRIGYSPDRADSAMGLLEVCRERLGFSPKGFDGVHMKRDDEWDEVVEDMTDAAESTYTVSYE